MEIKSINIVNFQSYYQDQEMTFGKGLNLILGNGGKGKSKLFNAFYWALFGEIYITEIGWKDTDRLGNDTRIGMNNHGFINKRALWEAGEGKTVICNVVLKLSNLENNKNIDYIIERTVEAKRFANDDWDSDEAWSVSQSELKISFDTTSGTRVELNDIAKLKIEDLFPLGIRNYIWFQGEALDKLIDFRKKDTLKSAVKHISYYPYYEKLSQIISISTEKIGNLERKKNREQNKASESVEKLISNIENNKKQLEQSERRRDKINLDIVSMELNLANDQNRLTSLSGYSGIVNDYNRHELEVIKINNELDTLDKYQRKQLRHLWILRGIHPMIDSCKKIIEDYTIQQDTVPEKRYLEQPGRAKLEEIISNKICYICGSDVLENSKAHNTILHRIKAQEEYFKEFEEYANNMSFSKKFERFIGSISDHPDSILLSLKNIDKHWQDSEEKIEKNIQKRRIEQKRLEELDEKILEIKRKFNVDPKSGAEQANVISSGLKATQANLNKLRKEFDEEKNKIRNLNTELRDDESTLEKINFKAGVVIAETEWKKISEFLKYICTKVQEKARKDLLTKIQLRANEFYEKFTKHDIGYKGIIEINEDYSIVVDGGLNTSHEDRKKMSIINAMLSLNQEALGVYYPFISDAPTSNFDISTTHSYLLGIKEMFDQTIIMTKDVDIDSSSYKELLLDKNVSKVYILKSQIHNVSDTDDLELYHVSSLITCLK